MKNLKKSVLLTLLLGMAGTILNAMPGSFRDKVAGRSERFKTRPVRERSSLELAEESRRSYLFQRRISEQEAEENKILINLLTELEREQNLVNTIKQQIQREEGRLNRSSNTNSSNVDAIVDRIANYKRGTVLDLSGLDINSEQLKILIPYIQRQIKEMGLKRLNLSNNRIELLPENFRDLNGLLGLNLSSNKLYYFYPTFNYSEIEFPDADSFKVLAKLVSLKALDLLDNCLKYIPWQLNKLSNLLFLDLSGNAKLHSLHDSFVGLDNLICLRLHRTGCGIVMRSRLLRRMGNLNLFF